MLWRATEAARARQVGGVICLGRGGRGGENEEGITVLTTLDSVVPRWATEVAKAKQVGGGEAARGGWGAWIKASEGRVELLQC